MLLKFFQSVQEYFKGWPNSYLTAALILAAIVIVYIALTGKPVLKALVLAYVVLP